MNKIFGVLLFVISIGLFVSCIGYLQQYWGNWQNILLIFTMMLIILGGTILSLCLFFDSDDDF